MNREELIEACATYSPGALWLFRRLPDDILKGLLNLYEKDS